MSRPHLIALLVLLLAGCSGEPVPWHGRNIQHVMPDLAFTLTDNAGHQVTAGDYRGKVILLYFGYAHCNDVCPTTLSTLTRAVRSLGEQADQARILFVSVDPQRDSPEVLHHHAMHFSPYVAGLTGNEKQLAEFAKRYRVSYSYGEPDVNGDYEVYHSSAIFVFDRDGKVRLLQEEKLGAEAIADDLRHLLNTSG